MRFDTRTFAIALHLLLTAQSAQAGPIMWTGRIYRRSTPVDGQYTTSAAPTAAHDDSQTDSSGSGTTPRPIFETLSTTLAYPVPGSSDTSGTPQPTVEAPVVDSTTEAQTKAPASSAEQSSATPSSNYPVDTTDFAESSTLTSTIVPEQPTATPTYTNTPGATKESTTTTAVEEETSAAQATSGATSAATSVAVITTSIVPKQPSYGTDASSANGTPTSAVGTVENTSAAQATQSIITTSIVPQQPTTTPSTQYQTPGGSSVVNTPTSNQTTAPAETSTAGDYQSTPSNTTTTTHADQDKHYPTSGQMQSSVDLGGLEPSSTGAAVSTAIQETSTVSPPTSAVNSQPTSAAATSEPGTTLTISVGNPDGTAAASSTEAQATSAVQATSTDVQATSTAAQATSTAAQAAPTYAAPSEPPSSAVETPSSAISSVVSSTEAAGSSAAATTIVPTGTPNTAVPVASQLPTSTAIIDANEYAENLSQARKLNQVYSGLTADSACSAGQAACINGKFAQCNSAGSYTLTDCGTNEKCFAFPATTVKGVTLSCQSLDKAKEILGTTGDDGSASSTTTTSAAEQPASSATTTTTEAAATTTEAKTQPNYPVVTVTQIVTIDDGATTTSEPAQQQTSVAVQPSEPTSSPDTSTRPHTLITITRTRSPSPETSSPAEDTATYEAPESTSESSQPHTVIVVTRTRPATSAAYSSPAETTTTTTTDAAATSALPEGSSTITKSIKTPGYPDSSATSQGESDAEPTQASTVLLVPIDDDSSTTAAPAAAATEAAVDGHGSTTTTTVDGTPTVSVYYTVTVTQKDHETVTVTQHEKETVTVVISA